MLAMLAAGNEGAAVKSMLPFISNHFIGSSLQAYLDENGDQGMAIYSNYQVNAEMTASEAVGTYRSSDNSISYNP